jgi:hypothetical protein
MPSYCPDHGPLCTDLTHNYCTVLSSEKCVHFFDSEKDPTSSTVTITIMVNPGTESSSAAASLPNSKPPASRWCNYRSATPAALGICCLLVSVINLWQAHQHHPAHRGKGIQGTAVHKAVREFLASESKAVRQILKHPDGTVKKPASGQKNGKSTVSRAEQKSGAEAKAAIDQDSPSYPTLECAAYGGPSSEIAQEMVYWQDIPSDTRYVSPFKGSADDDPKYMTFEPVRAFLVRRMFASLLPDLHCCADVELPCVARVSWIGWRGYVVAHASFGDGLTGRDVLTLGACRVHCRLEQY